MNMVLGNPAQGDDDDYQDEDGEDDDNDENDTGMCSAISKDKNLSMKYILGQKI